MTVRYGFIDGGYLRSKFYYEMEPHFGEVPDFHGQRIIDELGVDRVLWYDCEPREGEQSDIAKWNARQLEILERSNNFRLRLGTLSRTRKQGRPEQKEVDVLLAVDLLSHSFARNMNEAILVLGDLDIRPAIEEASRYGIMMRLFYDPTGLAHDLERSVDSRIRMDVHRYVRLASSEFENAHPLPIKLELVGSQVSRLQPLVTGTNGTNTINVYRMPDANPAYKFVAIVFVDSIGRRCTDKPSYRCDNTNAMYVLGDYFPRQYPGLTWETPLSADMFKPPNY